MPNPIAVLHPDLIPEQHLGATALPAAIPRAGKHEAAGGIDVDGRDDAAAVARNDGERDGAVARGLGLGHVVDAQDVVGSAAERKRAVRLMQEQDAVRIGWKCYLPDEMSFVGHGPHSVHRAAACLELEVAVRFAALAA